MIFLSLDYLLEILIVVGCKVEYITWKQLSVFISLDSIRLFRKMPTSFYERKYHVTFIDTLTTTITVTLTEYFLTANLSALTFLSLSPFLTISLVLLYFLQAFSLLSLSSSPPTNGSGSRANNV